LGDLANSATLAGRLLEKSFLPPNGAYGGRTKVTSPIQTVRERHDPFGGSLEREGGLGECASAGLAEKPFELADGKGSISAEQGTHV
jgi:hypothetical protein